jgi:serralysin
MDGGAGTDTVDYSAETNAVTVNLATGQASGADIGTDTLSNIENVIGGAGNDVLAGGGDNDIIDGGTGQDIIQGGNGNDTLIGGDGNDTLTGGNGDDIFLFDFTPGTSNIDTIQDFDNPGGTTGDVIHLHKSIFTQLGISDSALTSAEFLINAGMPFNTEGDSNTRIIYDSTNGGLYYDFDGSGTGGLVQFASMDTGLALTEDDFFVVS